MFFKYPRGRGGRPYETGETTYAKVYVRTGKNTRMDKVGKKAAAKEEGVRGGGQGRNPPAPLLVCIVLYCCPAATVAAL